MKQSSYQDPRWQRRRLEVMERDKWACVNCRASDRPLHVHHMRYDGELWDTPSEWLQTLCEGCHQALGEHPKGGVWWLMGDLCFRNCPMCGAVNLRENGSFVKCMMCGHRLVHPFALGVPCWTKIENGIPVIGVIGPFADHEDPWCRAVSADLEPDDETSPWFDSFRTDVGREKPVLAAFLARVDRAGFSETRELELWADDLPRAALEARRADLLTLARCYIAPDIVGVRIHGGGA